MKRLVFIFALFINFAHAKSSFQNTPLLSCNNSLRSEIDEPRLSRAIHFQMNQDLTTPLLMGEEWSIVSEFDGIYSVSNLGRIKTNDHIRHYNIAGGVRSRFVIGRIRKQSISKFGYYYVQFRFPDRRKNVYVHRYVAKSFIPNPDNKEWINHKDGNKLNNHISNLEWCTPSENLKHAFRTGLKKPSITSYNHQRGLSPRAMRVRVIETGEEYNCINDLLEGEEISKYFFNSRIGVKYEMISEYKSGTKKVIITPKYFRK